MAESYATIPLNAIQPLQVWDKGSTQAFASAENIVFEALISYFARWAIGKDVRGFFDLVFVHALAEPLHGASEVVTGGGEGDIDGKWSEAFLSGLRQCPSVFVADYCKTTFGSGFHIPSLKMSEILFHVASKVASRPIMKAIYENGPKAHKVMPRRQDAIANAQQEAFKANWKWESR